MTALHIPVSTSEAPVGVSPYASATAKTKSMLGPYQKSIPYIDAKGQQKYRVVLCPFLDIMHRIFRTSLFPRVGNLDMVHGHPVDMLLLCEECKGTTQTLDVCDIMWGGTSCCCDGT